MPKKTFQWFILSLFAGVILTACASTDLTRSWADKSYQGKSVSNILVIGITAEDPVRRSFESKFVKQLTSAGVEAISSADAIEMPADEKLKKETILNAVKQYNNDAVLITHKLGVEKRDVYVPPRYYGGLYGYYGGIYDYVNTSGYYTTHTLVKLETTLYDVETEKALWTGQSQTWNPESDADIIDGIIKVVIKELKKRKLLPKKK